MALGGDIPFALMLNGSAVTKASYRMIVRNCLNGVIRGKPNASGIKRHKRQKVQTAAVVWCGKEELVVEGE